MTKQEQIIKKLIVAAKAYSDFQSIGNGAKLNVAIEEAENHLKKLKPKARPEKQDASEWVNAINTALNKKA